MPYSPDDKQPLVPPALKRLNSDTKDKISKWSSVGPGSSRLSTDSPKYDFLEDSFMECELGLDLFEEEEPTGYNNFHNLNTPTGRLAKSTIHGVVNQFRQLHHRRSTVDRVMSAIGNVFRRLCHNEGGSVRLLAGYQNVNFKELSCQSTEASNQALTLLESEDSEEEEKAEKDRDEVVCAAPSYRADVPNSDTKNWVITRPKDRVSNLRRKKWTLSPRKVMYNDLRREDASIIEDSSDDDEHELNLSDLKITDDSKHQLQNTTVNHGNTYRSNGNTQRKLPFQNLFRRHRKHGSVNPVAHVKSERSRQPNADNDSPLNIDLVANVLKTRPTKLIPSFLRRRSLSLEVMYSLEEMTFGDGSKKRREAGPSIRMCSSALDQSDIPKSSLDPNILCPSASKSVSWFREIGSQILGGRTLSNVALKWSPLIGW